MNRRQAGFTLLEMLLAVSLLVLLTALAYATLRTGARGWEAANAQADREDALRVGWPFLHQALEAARPERIPGDTAVRFSGDAVQLSWVAELPAHFATGGPRLLTLAAGASDDGPRRLLLVSRALDETVAAAEQPQQAVLVDELDDVDISYYGADDDGAPTWQASWLDRQSLPQLVRVQVQPADGPAWPALIAHPYLAGAPPATDAPETSSDPALRD